jgi:ABC-type uncharacterized transport system substrate-binding protein
MPTLGQDARCLFVSSYHKGYAWSDGIEKGLREALAGKCELQQFDMDTKRHKDETSIRNAAKKARQLITAWNPDVVITADDNAAKYLIKPFFRDHDLPFVFCGINWSVEEYGFPYSNATGMIEVAPIQQMLEKADTLLNGLSSTFYIGAKTLTEKKNLVKIKQSAEKMQISVDHRLVESTAEWLKAYADAQHADLIIIGSSGGMTEWDPESIKKTIAKTASKLSVTNHGWMMQVTMLGFIKVPEEQGDWAGKVASSILEGKDPAAIPIVANRKWDLWVNEPLIKAAEIALPDTLVKKSKKVSY